MFKICCIMITYNPETITIENIHKLLFQSEKIVIVDNGSSNEVIYEVIRTFQNDERVEIILNEDNLGIAAALNIGVRRAIEMEYAWLATFDQDSSPQQYFFDTMFEAYNLCLDRDKIRIISPVYRDQSLNRTSSADGIVTSKITGFEGNVFREVHFSMTSGNLVNARLFSEIGFFEEKLFIDQVDHDFCLRCINSGHMIIESSRAILGHNLGEQTLHRFLNRTPVATNHSPIRRYYMARNRLYMYRKYFTKNTRWVLIDIMRFIKDGIIIVLFEKNRKKKLLMTVKGMRDYIAGKYGRYES